MLLERRLDIPFIIVSGTVGEEEAVALIKQGATDYLLKDRLGRLGTAITQALEAKCLRDEQQRAQATLRASETRFRALIEKSSEAILMVGADGVVIYDSPSVERVMGYTPDERPNREVLDFVHSEDHSAFLGMFASLIQTPGRTAVVHVRLWHKDQTWHWIEGLATNLLDEPSVGAIVINYRDVSERKRAEDELARYRDQLEQLVEQRTAELKRARRRVEAILNNTTDGIALIYPDRGIEQSNAMFNTLFACEPDRYYGQPLAMLMAPDDRDRLETLIQAVTANGMNRQGEFRALRVDNTLFEARIGLGYIQDGDVISAGLVCSIQDISELKRRERLLRYHASLQENVSDAVIATDLKFRIQSWNRAAEQIYSWRAEEVLGKLVGDVLRTEFVSDESGERVQRDFMEKGAWSDEVVQYHKDDHALQILSSTVLFKDESGQPFGLVAVNHDITERKQAAQVLEAKAQEEREFQSYLKELHEITIELTQIDGLDEFYRHTVQFGLEQLGFERLALFLYDAATGMAVGTHGTDLQG
ncbi:MAG: PAS domain S-box protein [Chloroflexota bacterium]